MKAKTKRTTKPRSRKLHAATSDDFHELLRRDGELWDRLVIRVGEQVPEVAGGHVLELGNCRVCMSMLSRRRRAG